MTASGEKWLQVTLYPFVASLTVPIPQVNKHHVTKFLAQYDQKPWRRHSFYRAFKTFFKWASAEFSFDNPMVGLPAPKTPDLVLNTITAQQVVQLLKATNNLRDKVIIALFADSGSRRSELANVRVRDLDMENNRIRVLGKGGKEGYLLFGEQTKSLIIQYIREVCPTGLLFDLNTYGLQSMLRRLAERTGINCNAHSFRRGFATSLRHSGVGDLDIQQLGRWSSLEMVRRYTKAYTFDDAAKRYKPIVT